jgi:hypothetical protein
MMTMQRNEPHPAPSHDHRDRKHAIDPNHWGLLIALLTWSTLASSTLADESPLPMRIIDEAGADGCFTPEGDLIVYARQADQQGRYSLETVEVHSGRQQRLVQLVQPHNAPLPHRAPGVMRVVAATQGARAVVLRRHGGEQPGDSLLLWRRGQRELVKLPCRHDTTAVARLEQQQLILCDPSVATNDVMIWDVTRARVIATWTVAPRSPRYDILCSGDSLIVMAQRFDAGAGQSEFPVRQLLSTDRDLGRFAIRRAIRRDGQLGTHLAPLLHGATRERPDRLIMTHGSDVLAQEDGKMVHLGRLLLDEGSLDPAHQLVFDPIAGRLWSITMRSLEPAAEQALLRHQSAKDALSRALAYQVVIEGFTLDAPGLARDHLDLRLSREFEALVRSAREATQPTLPIALRLRSWIAAAYGSRLLVMLELTVTTRTGYQRFIRPVAIDGLGVRSPVGAKTDGLTSGFYPAADIVIRVSRDGGTIAMFCGQRLVVINLVALS